MVAGSLTWCSRGWQIFFTLGFIEVTTNAAGLTPGTMFTGGRAPGPHPLPSPAYSSPCGFSHRRFWGGVCD